MARSSWAGGIEQGQSSAADRTAQAGVRFSAVKLWSAFVTWFNGQEFSENAILLSFAVAIGVLSALGVLAFYRAIDVAYIAFYRWSSGTLPELARLAYRPIVTGAGLTLAWWVMRRLGRGHDGMNVPDVQLAVVRRGGDVPSRPALARTLASAITIGGGGSAGSEGPVVVLGAAIGSWLGRAFRFTPERVSVFVGCASGAAISAAFNAPLAGAFFALEEILGSLSVASFSPVVVASVVSAVVSRAALGNHPAFPIPQQYGYGSLGEILVYFPLLGVVTGLVSVGYVRAYFAADSLARSARRRVNGAVVAAVSGVCVGVLVWLSNGLLVGYGHLALHAEMFGRLSWYALFLLAAGKILATSITLNGGGSGGVFTPSLYIGAATGGGFGVLLSHALPATDIHPAAYALVGMGALIAGATDAPITGLLLVFEMTNDYGIVLPLMLTVVVAHAVARRFERDSLYSGWLRRRGETITHGADRDVLAGARVRDAYDASPHLIQEDAPLSVLLRHLVEVDQPCFPVVSEDRRLVGVIGVSDLGRLAAEVRDTGVLIRAVDVAEPSEVISLGDSLYDAVRQMGVRGAAALPVVERGTGRVVGLITRGHVVTAYERRLAAIPRGSDDVWEESDVPEGNDGTPGGTQPRRTHAAPTSTSKGRHYDAGPFSPPSPFIAASKRSRWRCGPQPRHRTLAWAHGFRRAKRDPRCIG
jgi:CIC family chloride channel protein